MGSTCHAKTPHFPTGATHTRTWSVKEVRKRRAGFDVYLFLWGSTLTTSLPGWLTTAPSPVIPKVPDTPPHAGLEHPLPKGHVRHAVPHKSADLDGGGGWILRQQFFPQHVRARAWGPTWTRRKMRVSARLFSFSAAYRVNPMEHR